MQAAESSRCPESRQVAGSGHSAAAAFNLQEMLLHMPAAYFSWARRWTISLWSLGTCFSYSCAQEGGRVAEGSGGRAGGVRQREEAKVGRGATLQRGRWWHTGRHGRTANSRHLALSTLLSLQRSGGTAGTPA